MPSHFFLSLCCGIGGSAIAAKNLGFETFGIEINPRLAEIYRRNVGEVLIADITQINPYKIEVPSIEYRRRTGNLLVVQVSPECQKFSKANATARINLDLALSSQSANMLSYTFDHYDLWEPDVVILENVRAYQKSKVYQDFEKHLQSSMDWNKYN